MNTYAIFPAISPSTCDFGRFGALITLDFIKTLLYDVNMIALKEKLKTPKNTDELKRTYKECGLVYYTPLEELINVATHAFGALVAIALMIVMLYVANSAKEYLTATLSCGLIGIEFGISAIYHGTSNLKRKYAWRKIDFPAVNLNVIACAVATCLLYDTVFGYVALGVSLFITLAMFALCSWKFDVFRNTCVLSCFVIGAILFVAFFVAYNTPKGIADEVALTYLAGLISCLMGAMLFGVHKRYAHCIFHVFVLVGPILFLIATYLQLK